jgi:protein-S-isoprenylcysteine O-methyltransferase Ste14
LWLALRKPAGTGWASITLNGRSVAGLLLTCAGVAVYVWAARTLASGIETTTSEPTVLLKHGPFRFVRNPLYLAVAAVFVGMTTAYGFWESRDVLTVLLVVLAAHLVVVYVEEPATRGRLGPDYDAYRAEVPRWIPKPKGPKPRA